MADYLIDTNHLSPLVTLGNTVAPRLLQQLASGDSFAIATPVLSEMLFGIQLLPRFESNLREWDLLRDLFRYYDIDQAVAERAAKLRVELR